MKSRLIHYECTGVYYNFETRDNFEARLYIYNWVYVKVQHSFTAVYLQRALAAYSLLSYSLLYIYNWVISVIVQHSFTAVHLQHALATYSLLS